MTVQGTIRTSTMSTKTSDGKTWRKIHQERKLFKKKKKQEIVLKKLEKTKQLDELAKATKESVKETPELPLSTVSIAVPGSILENAQSNELKTYLAGQIARAACIFRVDEVIVFDDIGTSNPKKTRFSEDESGGTKSIHASCLQMARILQYLECPQYLRKFFFPLHKDLKYSGLLNPLDAPHHLRQQNMFLYREGVVTEKQVKAGQGSYVNVGLLNEILVDKTVTPGYRVTVKMGDQNQKKMKGTIVPPTDPRQKTGVYWGYTVRVAPSLSDVFTKGPYNDGYDVTVGTSDKGSSIQDIEKKSLTYKHLLVVFGGLKGLEVALEIDEKLKVSDPEILFDQYVNVLPDQGSRTIRTEEALLIGLSALQEKLNPEVKDLPFSYKDFIPQSDDTGIKFTTENSSSNMDVR